MSTRTGWTIGAVCVMIAGFTVLPAPAQNPQGARPEARETRGDKTEAVKNGQRTAKRTELEASREQLRAAYRSGDPAAIKTARENYQKQRSEARERDGSAARAR